MHISTVERAVEIVTVSGAQHRDAIVIMLDYIAKDGATYPQRIVFDSATYNHGWNCGSGWFRLNPWESDQSPLMDLYHDAEIFYRKLPWWKRFGDSQYAARQWVRDHVEFAIRPIDSEWCLYDKERTTVTRGQIIKGLWLDVIPLVDGKVRYDTSMNSGSFRTRWPVGEVTVGKVLRANAIS